MINHPDFDVATPAWDRGIEHEHYGAERIEDEVEDMIDAALFEVSREGWMSWATFRAWWPGEVLPDEAPAKWRGAKD